MDSLSSMKQEEQRRQYEIKRQIALLQKQLKDPGVTEDNFKPSSPKRKKPDSHLLVPTTPSPKKRRVSKDVGNARTLASTSRRGNQKRAPLLNSSAKPVIGAATSNKVSGHATVPTSAPSTVLQKLSSLSKKSEELRPDEAVGRSSGFKEVPAPRPSHEDDSVKAPRRDDRLALVEELELGPAEHKPPFDDPHFEKLEPNSGIRLSQRVIPHDEFQDYLRGRYYLSPSRLYSAVRLLPNKSGYEVPVFGDWVTIAVVAERGPIKFSRAPVATTKGGDGMQTDNEAPLLPDKSKSGSTTKRKEAAQEKKPHGKRYVNLKLIDFGARSGGSSSTGGKAVIRGDAFLTLLLFESDGCEVIEMEDEQKRKVWRGGSKGAFEAMAKLKEGAVVALLNPKVLKPFQRSNEDPHPVNNILALTPESADSIAVIGHSKDLGMCTVVKRDGKVCGGWCDKRVSDVCEYHIQNAVERRRAGRSEFSIGTSGMSANSGPKRKRNEYDSRRQWGLKPELDSGSGAVYVVSGHVVSGSAAKDMYIGESIGREGQAKAARKLAAKDTDRVMEELLKRDKEGMKALVKAREFGMNAKDAVGIRTDGTDRRKQKTREKEKRSAATGGGLKNAFSAKMIKTLGFDPTNKTGSRRVEDGEVQKKLQALSTLQSSRQDVNFETTLTLRPGRRRSQLSVPSQLQAMESVIPSESKNAKIQSKTHPPASDRVCTDGLPLNARAREEKMIDLDESESGTD
ncbi:hypothetical protein NEOLEDRAFT_1170979 [Neolentinus lepideus HHB14362 ss-1]|uniref:Zinc finger Mcm10/DnaG-type domain-containing protein n=1 Tax=Neolentinus lepideus HHB14362 ss-1 TaxID=1314782 RepID=A0A165QWQ6_9AGAM|nr:hypothetical protein NEOLEDRAFT_1170979 [Neolentinus lepideus HHB14362 ss-1]